MNRACELAAAPSTHLKPRLFPDGDRWCALYGENLQDGLCGHGKTPEEAMADFDHKFCTQTLIPANVRGHLLPLAFGTKACASRRRAKSAEGMVVRWTAPLGIFLLTAQFFLFDLAR